MTEAAFHRGVTLAEIALGLVTFVGLLFFEAPYGRYQKKGYGPGIPQRVAWIAMEIPAVVVWLGIYFAGEHALSSAPLALMGLFQLHYLQRTFVFPFRIRPFGKTTPLAVVLSAIGFNVLNAYVNARWVSEFGDYPSAWLTDARFLGGAVLFGLGFFGNIAADTTLIRLRSDGSSGTYAVPTGGLYRYISCPNYACEMLEWTGWAIATWSLAGSAFAIYTAANLVPRALSHHRFYRAKFPDYPPERKALIPFVL